MQGSFQTLENNQLNVSGPEPSSMISNISAENEITNSNLTALDFSNIERKKRNKIDEYSHIEEKQARLIKLLNERVYKCIVEENGATKTIADNDELQRVFYVVVELEQLALLVHEPVAAELKCRLDIDWIKKPYFGDILIVYYHYYKVYKAILARYPTCQYTLCNLLKRKPFASQLKKLLEMEAVNFDNVNRLDMLLDHLVDFPRRLIQLLDSYLKLLEENTQEQGDIKKVLSLLTEIFESSNESLNKMSNFKQCYEFQYMFDPPLLNIMDQNRLLIKHGSVLKVAKRNGELLPRHLALFTDLLLVCKYDRIRKKLALKYRIPSKDIKLIENSNEYDDLMFRIVSSDQNNEFKLENNKDKHEWLKAFGKTKDIQINSGIKEIYPDEKTNMIQIGIVPPIWVKDSEQSMCSTCKELFNTFKRRHHCRTCGRIYCNSCCNLFVPVKFNQFKEKVRVCKNCFSALEKMYLDHIKENGSKNLQESKKSESQFSEDIENIKTSKLQTEYIQPIFMLSSVVKSQIDLIKELVNKPVDDEASNDSITSKANTVESNENYESEKNEQFNTYYDSFDENEEDSSNYYQQSKLNLRTDTAESNSDSLNSQSKSPILAMESSSNPFEIKTNKLLTSQEHMSNISGDLSILSNFNSASSITTSKLKRLGLKKEILFSEFVFIKKIPLDEISQSDKFRNINWERCFIVLFNDNTLGIYSNQMDLNNAQMYLQLETFDIELMPDTRLIFILKESRKINDQSTLNDFKKDCNKLKEKLKVFEFNYELKFKNNDSRTKWHSLFKNKN